MTRMLMAALVTMSLVGLAAAADKPNYSGEWKLNLTKSNFGQFPPPGSIVRKIQHKDPALSIVEDQAAGGAQSTTTRKITTDGKIATQELNGVAAACSAVWDGADIVATTALDSVGLKFTDRMSVSSDGKTLTSKVHIASPQGEGDLTIVFDRQ
jgi:hypothetical protein